MGVCAANEQSNENKLSTNSDPDEFIIKLHRHQTSHGTISNSAKDELLSDQRRVVFISLIGLYQTWKLCPVAILYPAIFILPFKKKWIYFPEKYETEIKQTVVGNMTIFQDNIAFDEFICLLQWKDSQHLLFCMLDNDENNNNQVDEYKENGIDALIAPFWKDLSQKLTNLYDPVTKSKYNPIKLNIQWWKHSYETLFKSKYNTPACKILSELYFTAMNFKSMQEIIFQSNPKSLKPVIAYNGCKNILYTKNGFVSVEKKKMDKIECELNGGYISFGNNCCPDIKEQQSDLSDHDEGIWMISADYNEYDLSS